MGTDGAGADTQSAGGLFITRTIDNQPGDVVLADHSWDGWRLPRRGTTHVTAFSNDLGWAFILTVVHSFVGNIFAGIAFTGLIFFA